MGGEFGHFIEWNYKRELDWFLLDYDKHSGIQNYIRDLNHIYKNEKAFYSLDDSYDGFDWIDLDNLDQSVVVFMRKGRDDEKIIVVANFTPETYFGYKIGVEQDGYYEEILNSDYEVYGGSGVGNESKIRAIKESWHMRPYHIDVKLPPLSVVYFKRIRDDQTMDVRKQTEVKNNARNEKRNHRNDSSRGTGIEASRNH
jgi:1,4-alpha-glucan branching enzyme